MYHYSSFIINGWERQGERPPRHAPCMVAIDIYLNLRLAETTVSTFQQVVPVCAHLSE